jgi:hypothetical protein
MSSSEMGFLVLVLSAFAFFMVVLAWAAWASWPRRSTRALNSRAEAPPMGAVPLHGD